MKFFVHKLGCPKNDVDADYISARLMADGHQPVEAPEEAESVIVNTCGFILPAKEESIGEVLRLGQLKKDGTVKYLYASGCLSQRYGEEMLKEMPELDGAFGVGELDSLAVAMGGSDGTGQIFRTEAERLRYVGYDRRFIGDALPYAYIKISDGCDRTCSFCSIPSIRGKYRSRPMESILNEARYLAENGKKEIILVSQENSLYGHDLKQGYDILKLLKELDKIEDVSWIRLMYLYPTQVTSDLVDWVVSDGNKTLNYFDLPLQHVNTEVLSNMSRRTTREQTEAVVRMIRSKSREAVIRTTFIVGFPGETEDQFEELRKFVFDNEFDRLGVFTFSPEEGTPAGELTDQVPEDVKVARMDEIMTLQCDIAIAGNNRLIGTVQQVIIDSVREDGQAVGRTRADCPDIDQEVYVSGDDLGVGDICSVRIEAVEGYDLVGIKVNG